MATVPGLDGLVGFEYRGFSHGQLNVATVEGAGTDRLGLTIVVAAWDSCCYFTRTEQAGSNESSSNKNNKKN